MRFAAALDPLQRWRRTFWSVWAANLVTTMGLQSFLPFFPTHLEELGVEGRALIAVWTGAIFGAAPLAAALSGPVWGSLGDRIGRRAMVLRSLGATAVFVGLMALARTPLELLLLRLLQGAFSGVIAPSITLVSVAAPRERQGEVAGRLQSALALGAVAGPMLGAIVATWMSARSVFCVVALLAAAGALAVAFCAHEDPRLCAERASLRPREVLTRAKREAEELWTNARVRAAVVLAFWIQFAVSATAPLIELHVRDMWKGEARLRPYVTGALFTAMALASLVATQAWGRLGDRIGAQRALWISASATAALLLAHALTPGLLLLAFARPLLGAAMAGNAPCAFAAAAAETDVEHRGGGLGIVFSGRSFAIAFAALSGGWLSTQLGIRGLFAASALALGAAVLAYAPWRAATRAREAARAHAAGSQLVRGGAGRDAEHARARDEESAHCRDDAHAQPAATAACASADDALRGALPRADASAPRDAAELASGRASVPVRGLECEHEREHAA